MRWEDRYLNFEIEGSAAVYFSDEDITILIDSGWSGAVFVSYISY